MNTYKRHRFPPDIISYAVWLYLRCNLSHEILKIYSPSAPSQSATCIYTKPYIQGIPKANHTHIISGHSQGLPEIIQQRFQYTDSAAAFCSITTFLPPYRPNSTFPIAKPGARTGGICHTYTYGMGRSSHCAAGLRVPS